MEFERTLCQKLGMRVGNIRNHGKVGQVTFVKSKKIVSKQPRLRFYVNTGDLSRVVGNLGVEWKDETLKLALRRRKWTSWPASLRSRARELMERKGWACKKITDQIRKEFDCDVPYQTVYGWLVHRTRP